MSSGARRGYCAWREWGGTPPKGLTATDVEALLALLYADHASAARRDRALFAILPDTWTRLGFALALDVADRDLVASTATFRELEGGGSMTPRRSDAKRRSAGPDFAIAG